MRGGAAALAPGRDAIARVSWAAPYDGVARELVAALKFVDASPSPTWRPPRSPPRRAARRRPRRAGPAAPLRLRRRGFDPGELIAARLTARLGLELVPCLARRSGRRQVGRRRAERLARAPRIRSIAPPPRRVLLVDDVLTTGATLGACAEALRDAGAAEIEAAVFARSLGPSSSARRSIDCSESRRERRRLANRGQGPQPGGHRRASRPRHQALRPRRRTRSPSWRCSRSSCARSATRRSPTATSPRRPST